MRYVPGNPVWIINRPPFEPGHIPEGWHRGVVLEVIDANCLLRKPPSQPYSVDIEGFGSPWIAYEHTLRPRRDDDHPDMPGVWSEVPWQPGTGTTRPIEETV